MAQDELGYRITADSKGFVKGVNTARTSAGKLGTGKGARKGGAAVNQLAYALDDMQYGFRGVQNNLQAFAVQAGAGGPVVLAITALAIGINYVIDHWEDFQTETGLSLKIAQEFAKGIGKSSATYASLEFYAKILKDSASSTDEKTFALEQLKKNGYDPAKVSLDKFLESKKREIALNAADEVYQKRLSIATEKFAEAEEKKLKIAELRKKYDSLSGPNYNITASASGPRSEITQKGQIAEQLNELESEVRILESDGADLIEKTNEIYRGIVRSLLGGGDGVSDTGGGLPYTEGGLLEQVAKESEAEIAVRKKSGDSIKELAALRLKHAKTAAYLAEEQVYALEQNDGTEEEIFQAKKDRVVADANLAAERLNNFKVQNDLTNEELKRAFAQWLVTGDSGVTGLNSIFDSLPESLKKSLTTTTNEVTSAGNSLQAAIGSAFGDLGAALGEAIGGDGDIGTKFLKSLGKFMSSFGQALIALGIAEAAWLASFDPATKIVAGVALVIAGAAISASYSKKPGGGASSSGSSASASQISPSAASSLQGSGSQSSRLAIRGQDLRYINQAAIDSYRGTN